MGEAPSDTALLDRSAAGERAALATLYDRHAPALLGLALRILGDRSEAEDLVHDVFLEAWEQAHAFDAARSSVRHWLLLRTRSRAIDRLRRARARTEAARALEPPVESADTALAVDSERLAPALAELSDAQRQVVLMCFFSGLRCSEVAERLGKPPSTIRSRLAVAIAALRRHLTADIEHAP